MTQYAGADAVSGGSAGGIKKIASANASVTVTTPTGPTVGVEVATSPKLGGTAAATIAKKATVPAAATTVTGPDAYGAAAVVGTGTAYARDDHGHGLPAEPAGIPITAETSLTGVALINGTQTILSATVPNDGKPHQMIVSYVKHVTTALTGGELTLTWHTVTGTTSAPTTAGTGVGNYFFSTTTRNTTIVAPNTVISLAQTTAMTAGAAQVYAKIVVI